MKLARTEDLFVAAALFHAYCALGFGCHLGTSIIPDV